MKSAIYNATEDQLDDLYILREELRLGIWKSGKQKLRTFVSLSNDHRTKEKTQIFEDAKNRDCIEYFIALYEKEALPHLKYLPKSIVHNDLKPQNIFIKDKIFKIGDFGISNKLGQN